MSSFLNTLVSVWKNRAELNSRSFSEDERAFMPAALALQNKPPQPLPRILALVVLVIFVFVLIWSCLGKVDIVSSAEGKIIPSGRVKVIQPLEKSVVKEILVKDGDLVRQGSPLIILDQTQSKASSDRLFSEYHDSSNKAFSRHVFLTWLDDDQRPLNEVPQQNKYWKRLLETKQKENVSTRYLHWYIERCGQYLAERRSLKGRYHEIKAEQAVSRKVIHKLKRTLPLVTEHANSLDMMQSKKVVSRVQFLQVERERIQQEEDLATEMARLDVYESRMSDLMGQLDVHKATTRAQLLDELAGLSREVESLDQERKKADDINMRQTLRSPVDGRIQQVMVSTVGGIVTPAQELMLVVPENDQREVEVMLENKDIGFVYEGQTAEIKIHTFPFTKYGVIEAEVVHISDDAVADEKKGLIFPMRLEMRKNTILVNDRKIELKPGMSVTAEIKTGKRRLIEFFLAPILKSRSESIRER